MKFREKRGFFFIDTTDRFMYNIINQRIPQERREEINAKILYVIDTHSDALSREVIYNCYTGKGGLHGLERADYDNYHDFAEAKREKEEGQFFTPHEVCRQAAGILGMEPGETLIDPCCGMGNIFNWMPEGSTAFGNDIDPCAVKVARHLYPETKIACGDARWYDPGTKAQAAFLNPPFNLTFEVPDPEHTDYAGRPYTKKVMSQMWFTLKAHEWLEPAGLLLLVVPQSFLADGFWNKSDVEAINERFSFIGQTALDVDTFAQTGVEAFKTKIMVFSRGCDSIPHRDLDTSFCSADELIERVGRVRQARKNARMSLVRETLKGKAEEEHIFYLIRRILFHLHHNPALAAQHTAALAQIEKFRTQKPPENATKDELKNWEDHIRITPKKLLAYCRKLLQKQSEHPVDSIRLVSDRSGVKIKAYSPKTKSAVEAWYKEHQSAKGYDRTDLVSCNTHITDLYPIGVFGQQFDADCRSAQKRLDRERAAFRVLDTPLNEQERDADIDRWLNSQVFRNNRGEACHLTDLQKQDLGLVLQRPYALLNWQQGSGKTAAAAFFAKHLLVHRKVRTVFVLAPALAINLTWIPFLKANKIMFSQLKTPADVQRAGCGFLLVSTTMVNALKRDLMHLVRKRLGNRACLLFDESDEITNPRSVRTKAILDVFRRLRYKLLLTGTTTRNNIGELYSQLELLYNNSVNMRCLAPETWEWDKDLENMVSQSNEDYGRPFQARKGYGASLFRRCFCPGKATVFGIQKFDQSIYNAETLSDIVSRTILTRRFTDFAGEKYGITNNIVTPTEAEFDVYRKIINELHELIPLYFHNTGDARKESALRIMRTIQLLIKACSVPNQMPGYSGESLPSKMAKVLEMLSERKDKKVAIGVTTVEALMMYQDTISKAYSSRPLFTVDGSIEFHKRDRILKEFEATENGILLCTQQALKSSVNIPSCNEVILESLQWNLPKMAQFFFRFIRFDSQEWTNVHFITYQYTIEQNIMALLLTKERLNEFLKDGEIASQEDMFSQYGVSSDLFKELMGKESNEDGLHFTWGNQRVC